VTALFIRIWYAIRWWAGLILPFFAKAKEYRRIGAWLRWTLAAVCLVAVLAGLWWLNTHTPLARALERAPTPFGISLRDFWLPILFLLIVVLSWLGWWLWVLLMAEVDESEYPDIREAWDDGIRTLHDQGIELTDVPLFLVIGHTGAAEDGVFQAAQADLTVRKVPVKAGAPVHMWGNRDAVYVTCPGASLLGREAAILTGEAAGPAAVGASAPAEADEDPNKTMQPQGRALDIQAVLARARDEGRGPQQLNEDEKQQIQLLMAEEDARQNQAPAKRARSSLLRKQEEVEELTARLRYLCRLVVRDREGYCPINGLMLLVPLAATDSDEDANQVGELCRRDLKTARDVLQVHCPLFVMVCDVENVPGFEEFIGWFQEKERGRRVGQRFPLVPDIDVEKVGAKVDESVRWIGDVVVPSWVYKLFRVESTANGAADPTRFNTRLFRMMVAMRERQKRLSRILVRGIPLDEEGPPLFGGCYIAGTGKDARSQGFVAGVFQRLSLEQNFVSWTAKGEAEEARFRWLTSLAYVAVGLLGVAAIALLVVVVKDWQG
jgi:hypothetical protein